MATAAGLSWRRATLHSHRPRSTPAALQGSSGGSSTTSAYLSLLHALLLLPSLGPLVLRHVQDAFELLSHVVAMLM